jgi:hypothetical protein
MANTNSQLAVKKFFTVEELNMLLLLVNDVFLNNASSISSNKAIAMKVRFSF